MSDLDLAVKIDQLARNHAQEINRLIARVEFMEKIFAESFEICPDCGESMAPPENQSFPDLKEKYITHLNKGTPDSHPKLTRLWES